MTHAATRLLTTFRRVGRSPEQYWEPSGVTNNAVAISLYSSAVFFPLLDTLPVMSLENPKAWQ